MIKRNIMLLVGVAFAPLVATAQSGAQDQVPDLNAGSGTTTPANSAAPAPEPETERWNLFYQATSIGQYHGTFRSPYAGVHSLQDYPERDGWPRVQRRVWHRELPER